MHCGFFYQGENLDSFPAVMGALTLGLLGTTAEKFAKAKLGSELSLLADTGNI